VRQNRRFHPPPRLAAALLLTIALTLCATPTHAYIVIHKQAFIARGGDPDHLDSSLPGVLAPLRAASTQHPFTVVGLLDTAEGQCTATWLGDSSDSQTAYLLTAAHCLPALAAQQTSFEASFFDWAGRRVASGRAQGDIHPGWKNRSSDTAGLASDLALVRVPKRQALLDRQGRELSAPWLYDQDQEVGQPMDWVGYGQWGVSGPDNQDMPQPDIAQRRLWYRTQATASGHRGFTLKCTSALLPTALWARSASGDSGSAWWLQQQGLWSIAALTHGRLDSSTLGPRISRHIDWLRAVYPQARLYSQQITVSAQQAVQIPDSWLRAQRGELAYIVPAPGRGPVSLERGATTQPSRFSVALRRDGQGEYQVNLRAARCGASAMNGTQTCADPNTAALRVSYHAEDNRDLPAGNYAGDFMLEARGILDAAYSQMLGLRAEIAIN
jgi:hypothetical protein